MLTDVSSASKKSLDRFYNELRRKYPNTFTITTDLGKGDGSVQKLPCLERNPSAAAHGILPSSINSYPHRWTPDSFLSKVQLQKIKNEQRQKVENFQQNEGAVIRDEIKPVLLWNKRDYLAGQNQTSFRLPNLRTQVEQNKAELQNRLVTTKKVNTETKINASPSLTLINTQKPADVWSSKINLSTREGSKEPKSVPGPKSDPLGTIMKELLPSKPGRIMTDLPKNNDILYRNDVGVSDSDFGVSVCTPIKVFRPKIRNLHEAPASSDIIKKLSAQPKAHPGPMKADHIVLPENGVHIANVEQSIGKIFLKKSSINYNEKITQRPSTARVLFEDESEQEAEVRYQERRLLERIQTKGKYNNWTKPQLKSLETIKALESNEISLLPSTAKRLPIAGQKNTKLPSRCQPFPPNVAKNVLIDIPRSGLTSRRPVPNWMSQVMKDKQLSSSNGKEAIYFDGITMSFKNPTQEWKEQNPSISESKKENKCHHSFSSLETIGSRITEVSSEVTKTTLDWRSSGSSISSGSQRRSSSVNHNPNLNHSSLGKGREVSLYSRVKKSLRVKMKMSSDARMMHDIHQSGRNYYDSGSQPPKSTKTDQGSDVSIKLDRREKVASHGKSSATSTHQVIMRENESRSISQDWMKMDAEAQTNDRDVPMKAPFLSMRKMQCLLKKGRAKNYVVRVPTPPSESRWKATGVPRGDPRKHRENLQTYS
ncbi:uncharacterized protein [Pyxicephalus adspersus]|uniref:uncharacterized protein n=1 Tax=Pyxicephalus adspersus TaxID=30357 RepID=UPI003B5A0056